MVSGGERGPGGYLYPWEEIYAAVRDRSPTRLGVQIPEGLKVHLPEIAKRLREGTGVDPIFATDPMFGACDVMSSRWQEMGVEPSIHFGHSPIPRLPGVEDIIFVPLRWDGDVDIAPIQDQLVGPRIALVATTQHMHLLPSVEKKLRQLDLEPVVMSSRDPRLELPGQILGCNVGTVDPEADSVLYLGSGMFHPLAIALTYRDKPVLCLDPVEGQVIDVAEARDRIVRQRSAAIALAQESGRRVGILVGTKPGQQRLGTAAYIRKVLEAEGYETITMSMDFIAPATVDYLPADWFVNTACPRIAYDDGPTFARPVLTPEEAEIVSGRRTWEQWTFDEFRGPRN